jgi:aspartyl protease family protein
VFSPSPLRAPAIILDSVEPNPHASGGKIMLAIAWLLIMGGVYWFFNSWDERQTNPNPASVINQQRGELVLQRNRDGHYVADGEINGRPVVFLVDTGATWVALPTTLARQLEVRRGPAVTVQTANGPATGFQTRLDSVKLGPIEMQDIGAIVTDGMDDNMVLLGMNFLKRLELIQRGDTLTLRRPSSGS